MNVPTERLKCNVLPSQKVSLEKAATSERFHPEPRAGVHGQMFRAAKKVLGTISSG